MIRWFVERRPWSGHSILYNIYSWNEIDTFAMPGWGHPTSILNYWLLRSKLTTISTYKLVNFSHSHFVVCDSCMCGHFTISWLCFSISTNCETSSFISCFSTIFKVSKTCSAPFTSPVFNAELVSSFKKISYTAINPSPQTGKRIARSIGPHQLIVYAYSLLMMKSW